MTHTGFQTRRPGVAFWAVVLAFTTAMAFTTVPTPLWSLYAQRDRFSSLTVTVAFAVYALAVALSLFLAGDVFDWYGRRRVLMAALALEIVAALVFLAWPALGLVARVLSGLAVGAITATVRDSCPAFAATALPAAARIGADEVARPFLRRRARRRDHDVGLRPADLAGAEFPRRDAACALTCAGRRRVVRRLRDGGARAVTHGVAPTDQLLAAAIRAPLAGLGLLTIALWLPTPSFGVFLADDLVLGAGAGLMFRGAIARIAEISCAEHRAEALAGLFLAAYLGLAGPVVGLGALTQFASTRVSVLVFAALLALAILAATPALLGRSRTHRYSRPQPTST
jgi:MFS family permease